MSSFWDGFKKQADSSAAEDSGVASGAVAGGAAGRRAGGAFQSKRLKELKEIARTSGHHAENATHKILRPGFAAAAKDATHAAEKLTRRHKMVGGALGAAGGLLAAGAGVAGLRHMRGQAEPKAS
jgi:ferric-dicitrate binding protein FerR (iron transport regulator)